MRREPRLLGGSHSRRSSQFARNANSKFGMDYSGYDFYVAAMEAIEFEAQLVHDGSKPEGMKAKLMDSSKARNNNGWDPQTDLVAGLQKTYTWFLESQDKDARL